MNTNLSRNEKPAKSKRRTNAKLSLLLLILLVMSLITASFAWFTVSDFSSVENIQVSIGTGVQLLISGEDHGDDLNLYSNTLTNADINKQLEAYETELGKVVLDPVTSSNGRVFYNERGIQRTENNESYLEFDAYFIGTEDMWVHLTSTESKTGADDGTKVTSSDTGPRADIVNCTRVSFTDKDTGETVIYEPNKAAAVAGQNTFDLPRPMQLSNSTRLFKLTALTPKQVTVRIWIEGEDPQCDDDVQLANLQVQLNFEGTDDNNVPLN